MDFNEWRSFWSTRKYIAISNDDLNERHIRTFITVNKEIVYSVPDIGQCLRRIGITENDANNYKFVSDIKFPKGTALISEGNENRVLTLGDVFRFLEYDEEGNLINIPSLKFENNDNDLIENLIEQFRNKQIAPPFEVPQGFEPKEANSNQRQNHISNSNDNQIPNDTIPEQLDDKIKEFERLNSQLTDQSKETQTLKKKLSATQKQLDDKIKEFERLNSQLTNQSDTKAYNNRGIAYKNLGQYERAISDYNKAIKLNPNYSEAHNNRGNTYQRLKQYERAIADYDKALELNPNYATAYYNRGNACYNLKQYEQAIADYDKALELNPNYAEAYYGRRQANMDHYGPGCCAGLLIFILALFFDGCFR